MAAPGPAGAVVAAGAFMASVGADLVGAVGTGVGAGVEVLQALRSILNEMAITRSDAIFLLDFIE